MHWGRCKCLRPGRRRSREDCVLDDQQDLPDNSDDMSIRNAADVGEV